MLVCQIHNKRGNIISDIRFTDYYSIKYLSQKNSDVAEALKDNKPQMSPEFRNTKYRNITVDWFVFVGKRHWCLTYQNQKKIILLLIALDNGAIDEETGGQKELENIDIR